MKAEAVEPVSVTVNTAFTVPEFVSVITTSSIANVAASSFVIVPLPCALVTVKLLAKSFVKLERSTRKASSASTVAVSYTHLTLPTICSV